MRNAGSTALGRARCIKNRVARKNDIVRRAKPLLFHLHDTGWQPDLLPRMKFCESLRGGFG